MTVFTKYDLQNPEFTSHAWSEACVQNYPEPSDPVRVPPAKGCVDEGGGGGCGGDAGSSICFDEACYEDIGCDLSSLI